MVIVKIALGTLKVLMILGMVHWVAPDLGYEIGYYTSQVTIGWFK